MTDPHQIRAGLYIYTLYFSKPENHRVYIFLFVKRLFHIQRARVFMYAHYTTDLIQASRA